MNARQRTRKSALKRARQISNAYYPESQADRLRGLLTHKERESGKIHRISIGWRYGHAWITHE